MIIFKTYYKSNASVNMGIEILRDNISIRKIDNLSDDKESIENLVSMCNDLQIEECHIDDIIDDYLTDFSV